MTNQVALREAVTALALVVVTAMLGAPSALAQHYSVLYTFKGAADGRSPYSALIRDTRGNLYGTTATGGGSGSGAIFELDPAGTLTVPYTFMGAADGLGPFGGVIRDTSGNLYGATWSGGTAFGGSVFTLTQTGTLTTLFSFDFSTGVAPYGGLLRDAAGNLYGTDSGGGSNGVGTVFEITPAGVENILFQFSGGTDGGAPFAGLVSDAAGNLYGTATAGGNLNCGGIGCGVVFKVSGRGQETPLYSFSGPDGAIPVGGLVHDAVGNLYGTTYQGGAHNLGIVFKLDNTGQLTVLHNFAGGVDGANPVAGLVWGAPGYLYGTTALGGSNEACPGGCGTVFAVSVTGGASILHRFAGDADGAYPEGGLLAAGDSLYGTTYAGGTSDAGVVFKLTP